jgi:hypothetical protein
MDAESVITKFLVFAAESFERVRKELHK